VTGEDPVAGITHPVSAAASTAVRKATGDICSATGCAPVAVSACLRRLQNLLRERPARPAGLGPWRGGGEHGTYAICKRAIVHSNSHLNIGNPVDRYSVDHLRALWVVIV
jgi:hypothetical protein